jgi:retron-type reverse transcriptase
MAEWAEIAAAGGVEAWIESELRRRGLKDESTDTTKLSEGEKKNYKARREEERRVKKELQRAVWAAYRGAHLVHVGRGVFHHDTPDVDRFDVADPPARRLDNDLPEIADAQALAKALGFTIPRLRFLVFHREVDSGTHYRRWKIPKRDGKMRLISAPKPDLKNAQRWIATHIVEHLPVHGAAHGFIPGRSTKTNARAHAGARLVAKIDLSDFYPTVTLLRVKGIFRKAGYGEQVATLLALLCTESPREEATIDGKTYYVAVAPRSLPQGAPTSPSITNVLCRRLDARVAGLAKQLGFSYTRYADDLTFSYRTPKKRATIPLGKLLHRVRTILEEEGFELHPKKTRVMRSGRRQKVTGLVVNEAPNRPPARVPRKTVRMLRAAITNRERNRPSGDETLTALKGLAAYVHMTDPDKGRAFLERIQKLEEKEGRQP